MEINPFQEPSMPRYKEVNRNQGMLIPLQFSHQLMPGTFEYALDYIVDQVLDLKEIECRYKNELVGASAYDPRIMIKVILFAYSRGITGSRQIEEACNENVIFMALSGDNKPCYTTIALFLRSMRDVVERLFMDVVMYCDELGLIGGEMFAIDGCKISSNASKEWSGTREDFRRKKEKYRKTIKLLMDKHQAEDDTGKKGKSDRHGGGSTGASRREREERAIERMKEKIHKIEGWLKENPEDRVGVSGKAVKSNISDPESGKLVSSHGVVQGYNGVAIADEKNQVIVTAEAYGSGSEKGLLGGMADKASEAFKEMGQKGGLEGKVLLADSGYHSEKDMKDLYERKIDGYVADNLFRKRDPSFNTAKRHKKAVYGYKEKAIKGTGRYVPDDFTYDEKKDKVICPAGM